MKKLILLCCALSCVLGLISCGSKSGKDFDPAPTGSFQATVVEAHDDYLMVEPLAGSNESKSADRIHVSLKNKTISWPNPTVNDVIEISYDGSIMETYPAQLGEVYHIEIVTATSTN